MRCSKPFLTTNAAFPCGQCESCRRNRRRVWTHRIMLEASCHENNSFVTLTYGDGKVPAGGSLVPRDLQLFIKRLRRNSLCPPIRYFACGEYGDKSARPHYHAALFGYPSCQAVGIVRGDCSCQPCSVVRETWGYGHVMLGELSICSAAYIAGYVVKKWTRKDEPALEGRHPEFARMSRNGGIGVGAAMAVASAMKPYLSTLTAVPVGCRHSSINASLPLGRYMRNKISEITGLPPSGSTAELEHELRLVRSFAFAAGKSVEETFAELAGEAPRYKERGSI